MTTLTIAQITALCTLISDKNVTVENMVEIRAAAAQIASKFITGEAITKDESTILSFMTNSISTAIVKGEAEAAFKAGEVARVKKFEAEMSVHKLEVNSLLFAYIANLAKTEKIANSTKDGAKTRLVKQYACASTIKADFEAFLSTLPKVPVLEIFVDPTAKKVTAKKATAGTNTTTTKDGKNMKALCIAEIAANATISKQGLLDLLVVALPERELKNVTASLNDLIKRNVITLAIAA